MRKQIFVFLVLFTATSMKAQRVDELFGSADTRITYLGIDFSHVKLVGNFAEFFEAGRKNVMEIRDFYFPRWNSVVVNEREKFDISGMLRKNNVYYDLSMINAVNARTNPDSLESYNAVVLSPDDISKLVLQYDLEGKQGIGVVFVAESLNKSYEEAYFHFVAINMDTREVIFQRRLRGQPQGFGLRNYWINSLYRIINDVKYYYYNEWKIRTAKEGMQV
ncbi:MAG: hypothetical protein R6X09_07015 [Bacteroidales bacterium]